MEGKKGLKASSVLGLSITAYIFGSVIAGLSAMIIGSYTGGEENENAISIVSALIIVPLVYKLLKDGELWSFKKCNWKTITIYIFIGLATIYLMGYILEYVTIIFNLQESNNVMQFNQLNERNVEGNIIINFLGLVITPAICEELMFRGVLFGVIRTKKGFWFSAILSSLIFGALHGMGIYLIVAFITGIVLCMVYEVTNSIIVPIGIHFLNNFMVLIETTYGGIGEIVVFSNKMMNIIVFLILMGIFMTLIVMLMIKVKKITTSANRS